MTAPTGISAAGVVRATSIARRIRCSARRSNWLVEWLIGPGTDNKSLENEGKADQLGGDIKEKLSEAGDAIKDKANEVAGKIQDSRDEN